VTRFPCRPGRAGPRRGCWWPWGDDETGQRVVLDVVLGQRKRCEDSSWAGARRGLGAPMLVVTERGARADPGDGGAVAGLDRQRCTVRRLRNLVAKLPRKDEELRTRSRRPPGRRSTRPPRQQMERMRLRQLVADLERSYPSAAACLAEDLPARCVHLAYPLRLRKRLRSANPLERSLEEVRPPR
jgi:putative transposase